MNLLIVYYKKKERNKYIIFFDLYFKYSHNYDNNFLDIDITKIGTFLSIDAA